MVKVHLMSIRKEQIEFFTTYHDQLNAIYEQYHVDTDHVYINFQFGGNIYIYVKFTDGKYDDLRHIIGLEESLVKFCYKYGFIYNIRICGIIIAGQIVTPPETSIKF